jgi:hypothetical protein
MITNSVVDVAIKSHLSKFLPKHLVEAFIWTLPPGKPTNIRNFRVLELEPTDRTEPTLYVSNGMWLVPTNEEARYEFIIFAPKKNAAHIETLNMLSSFHEAENFVVAPGEIINLGRPWTDSSSCDHLLVSLPYLLGPEFEFCDVLNGELYIRFLWLMPITEKEAEYGRKFGIEKLEAIFENNEIDVLNFSRKSCV